MLKLIRQFFSGKSPVDKPVKVPPPIKTYPEAPILRSSYPRPVTLVKRPQEPKLPPKPLKSEPVIQRRDEDDENTSLLATETIMAVESVLESTPDPIASDPTPSDSGNFTPGGGGAGDGGGAGGDWSTGPDISGGSDLGSNS